MRRAIAALAVVVAMVPMHAHAQTSATGDKKFQICARCEEGGDERSGRRDLLEVIEHKEHVAVVEVIDQAIECRAAPIVG